MIRYFLFLGFILQLWGAPSVVFVHLGPKLPDYLSVALDQVRLFNPEIDLYLILHEEAMVTMGRDVMNSHPILVTCESLFRSKEHAEFLSNTKVDKKKRKGFWLFTTERFFYLSELIQSRHLRDVFHLENDVMLYTDLTTLLPIFREKYQNMIGATFDNEERCIPGFMYISSFAPIDKLMKYINKHADKKKYNDMLYIADFKKKYVGKWIEDLPIIMPEYSLEQPLLSLTGLKGSMPEQFSRHFDQFHSLFDAAAIGQYLGGTDPLNKDGKPGFINERCLFNPSLLSLDWRPDSLGRLIPHATYNNTTCPINNLHIHSKNLQPFYSLQSRE